MWPRSLQTLRTSPWVPTFIRRWLVWAAARRKSKDIRAAAALSTVMPFDQDVMDLLRKRQQPGATSSTKPPVAELTALLSQRCESRARCRDLVIVETTLQQSRAFGEDQYTGLGESVLSRAIDQLESLVDVKSYPGLAHLHFQMRRRRDALQLRRSMEDRHRQRVAEAQERERAAGAEDSAFPATEPMPLADTAHAAIRRDLLLMTLRAGDDAAAHRPERMAGFEVIEVFSPANDEPPDFVDTEVMPSRFEPLSEFAEPSVGPVPPELLLQLERPLQAA